MVLVIDLPSIKTKISQLKKAIIAFKALYFRTLLMVSCQCPGSNADTLKETHLKRNTEDVRAFFYTKNRGLLGGFPPMPHAKVSNAAAHGGINGKTLLFVIY